MWILARELCEFLRFPFNDLSRLLHAKQTLP